MMKDVSDIGQARRQIAVWEKAVKLFQQGYTAYETAQKGVWGVYSPEGKAYTVNLNEQTCDCPDFVKREDYCKHVVGLHYQLDKEAEEDALCAQAEVEAEYWKQKAEDDFRLVLTEQEGVWQFVDALGRVRVQSPSRTVLESNTALQQSAEMASRCAETGILLRGQARWNV